MKNANNFLFLQNKTNNAIVLIRDNSSELLDYVNQGYRKVNSGRKSEVLNYIEEYWSDNDIPEDERLFVEVK